MGYADWFYIKDNIVGYTGVLNNPRKPPTVYFVRKEEEGGFTYGHITQYHRDPENVGREDVNKCRVYAITNQKYWFLDEDTDQAVLRLGAHECVAGRIDACTDPGKNRDQYEQSEHTGILMGKGFSEVHPSRQPFFPVTSGSRDLLATSIDKFKEMKVFCRKRLLQERLRD